MTNWDVARANMVESQIRPNDGTDPRVLKAMAEVPREAFVPLALRPVAYVDEDLAIGEDDSGTRYIMEPMPFARLVQAADIGPDDLVLDVGCATGYSSAVIGKIANSVVALEASEDMVNRAQGELGETGVDNVAVVQGPLPGGYPSEAPFDVIVLEGSVGAVPEALFDQLAEGGRLVAVLNDRPVGVAVVYVKVDGVVGERRLFDASVRPLPGLQHEPAFIF